MHRSPARTTGPTPEQAHLVVTRMPNGRYCVAYTDGTVSRRSYTPSPEQIVRQAQRAGNIPIRTDDDTLRQHCQDANLTLLEAP